MRNYHSCTTESFLGGEVLPSLPGDFIYHIFELVDYWLAQRVNRCSYNVQAFSQTTEGIRLGRISINVA